MARWVFVGIVNFFHFMQYCFEFNIFFYNFLFYIGVREISWRRKWQPAAVFLPRKFHGQNNMENNIATKQQQRKSWLMGWLPWGGSVLKNLPEMQETWVWSLGWDDPLEKEMATHSSIHAWRIAWTEKPGWLQSLGSKRIRHNVAMKWQQQNSWLTMLRYFQVDSKGTQPYIYMCPFPPTSPPIQTLA